MKVPGHKKHIALVSHSAGTPAQRLRLRDAFLLAGRDLSRAEGGARFSVLDAPKDSAHARIVCTDDILQKLQAKFPQVTLTEDKTGYQPRPPRF